MDLSMVSAHRRRAADREKADGSPISIAGGNLDTLHGATPVRPAIVSGILSPLRVPITQPVPHPQLPTTPIPPQKPPWDGGFERRDLFRIRRVR